MCKYIRNWRCCKRGREPEKGGSEAGHHIGVSSDCSKREEIIGSKELNPALRG